MSQSLNTVPTFDGTNYGYWKAHMRFFLKSIDCWSIFETTWTKPTDATLELVTRKNARLSNDKALYALCQALSPSEFARISNSESAKEAWQILETTYEGTKLVKSIKLQMLISKFEEIKMLEDETFGEFYSKMSDLRNQMVSLGKTVSDVKLIRKIIRSFPECFRIKVTTIEESKDLEKMKIEELVGSLQTYELSLPPVKKLKTIALKASKKKVEVSSGDDSEDEEKAVAMLAKNFERLMRNERFKKKFLEKMKKVLREAEPEEKPRRKIPGAQDVMNARGLGISRPIVGISSKVRGRRITRLSVMSPKKKKLLTKRNF
jgi:lipoate-protein ligase A